jgi:fructokinase
MKQIAAFDIGGTKTELSIFRFESATQYERIATVRFPTDRQQGIEHLLEQLNSQTQELLNSNNISADEIDAIGIGLPGTVDPQSRLQTMGNTAILNHVDLKAALKETFSMNCPVQIANDANCFALAEAVCGAAKDYSLNEENPSSVIGIILGTGVGGGLIINQKMMEGKAGGCAEIGHTIFSPNGPMCYCGQRGCVEQVLSGPAFEASFNSRRYNQVQEFQRASEIFDLAARLDPIALATLNEYKQNLGTFLTQLTNMFDPDAIVIGGGMSKQDVLYSGLEDLVAAQRFVPVAAPKIFKNELGDSAGIVGAALIAYQTKA